MGATWAMVVLFRGTLPAWGVRSQHRRWLKGCQSDRERNWTSNGGLKSIKYIIRCSMLNARCWTFICFITKLQMRCRASDWNLTP